MKKYITAACAFYGIGIAGIGFQQFIYADFRPVVLPAWPSWIHMAALAYLVGAALIIAGGFILVNKKVRAVSLAAGFFLLALVVIFHLPFLLFFSQTSPAHLYVWSDPLKELALSGGAFLIAGLFKDEARPFINKTSLFAAPERLIPVGKIFFCTTMIVFGIEHFVYPEFVVALVPNWIPGHLFWTYFAAVALIGAGVAILLNIKTLLVAQLLALMLFLWLILLHIPRAIADPHTGDGNEITSVFEALAFSGISLAIACAAGRKKAIR